MSAFLGGARPFAPTLRRRLMFGGDSNCAAPSITAARAGFRFKVMLLRPGLFLPVGSLNVSPPPPPFEWADKHEGRVGYTTGLWLADLPTIWAANPADIVFLHLGTNDVITGVATATTASNTAAILDYIHAQSPATIIYRGTTINFRSDQAAFNATMVTQRSDVAAACAGRAWVRTVNMPSIPDVNFDDFVHLLSDGYQQMADAWVAGL